MRSQQTTNGAAHVRHAVNGHLPLNGARKAKPAIFEHWTGYPGGSRQAAFILQVFVIAVFLLPSDSVIRVIGAQGYVAALVAMTMFVAWILTAILGFHNPLHAPYPVRGALGLLWISSLLSYAAMPYYAPDATQRLGAGRWVLLLAGMSGVILVAAERLRTPRDILRVVRALVVGATISAVVATLQFWMGWDLKPIIRVALPGFSDQGGYSGFQARDALIRVSGTGIHPIEMGVVAAMVLPLAVWLAFYDQERPPVRRWVPVALIAMCVPMSVSRSAVLALTVGFALFALLLPLAERAQLILLMPVGVVAIFATTPGYLRTISNSFSNASTDPSVTNRLDNYPRVLAAVREAPWLGRGGGTTVVTDATKILDNQYLSTVVELGIFGLVALCLFLFVPIVTALAARRSAQEPLLRSLSGAVASGCLGGAVASYTFDSFAFPQFTSVYALLAGLCGTCWLYTRRSSDRSHDWPVLGHLSGSTVAAEGRTPPLRRTGA